jgi:hypothetical protein
VALDFVRELVAATGTASAGPSAAFSFTTTQTASPGDLVTLFILSKLTTNADANSLVTDSRGNTWTTDVHQESANNYAVIASTLQDVGTLQSGDTITVTVQGGNTWGLSNFVAYWVEEFSGPAVAPVTDKTASANNASALTGVSGTTAATVQADEMAFAGIITGSGETTLTAVGYDPFPTTMKTSTRGGLACYKILTATGAQSVTFNWTAAADFSTGVIATYKAAGPAVPENRFMELARGPFR